MRVLKLALVVLVVFSVLATGSIAAKKKKNHMNSQMKGPPSVLLTQPRLWIHVKGTPADFAEPSVPNPFQPMGISIEARSF
jgi:hypothetical protein